MAILSNSASITMSSPSWTLLSLILASPQVLLAPPVQCFLSMSFDLPALRFMLVVVVAPFLVLVWYMVLLNLSTRCVAIGFP